MSWVSERNLVSAISNAGGFGIIETSSGRLDEVREEVKKMKTLTDKPWGINVAQAKLLGFGISAAIAAIGPLVSIAQLPEFVAKGLYPIDPDVYRPPAKDRYRYAVIEGVSEGEPTRIRIEDSETGRIG